MPAIRRERHQASEVLHNRESRAGWSPLHRLTGSELVSVVVEASDLASSRPVGMHTFDPVTVLIQVGDPRTIWRPDGGPGREPRESSCMRTVRRHHPDVNTRRLKTRE